jgi:hypothetical protein
MAVPKTPTFLQPPEAGLTSNALSPGAPGGMNVPMSVRYRSPAGPSDGPADVRSVVTQTKLRGVTVNPTRFYDSGWKLSNGIASPLPAPVLTNPRGAAYYGGRVYVLDTSTYNTLWSAPVNGLHVGTWRAEQSPGWEYALTGDICVVGNRLYLMVQQNWFAFNGGIIWSDINADGTFGGWIQPDWFDTGLPITQGSSMVGLDKGAGANGQSRGGFLFFFFGNTSGSATCGTARVEPDGTVTIYWVPGPNVPVSWYYGSGHADRSGYLYIIPGWVTNTYWAPFDYTAGTIGAWQPGPPLPAAATRSFAFAAPPEATTPPGANNNSTGDVMWVIYGFTGTSGYALNQALWNSSLRFRNANTWWPVTLTGGTAVWGAAGACWPIPNQDIRNSFGYAVGVFGGDQYWDGARGWLPVQRSQVFYPNGPSGFGPWAIAPDAPGALMTPEPPNSLNQEPDGSWDYDFTLPGPNLTPWGGPYDGDEFTVETQFISQLSGDASPAALTSYRYGKPPEIVNFGPSDFVQHGNPTFSWQFQPGAQGGYQATWQIQVYSGPKLVADSGLRQDTLTSWTPEPGPRFQPGVQYTATLTVASADSPLGPADTAIATTSVNFVPQYTPLLPPTGLTLSTDSQRCAILANWTNPAGVAFNRVYYRRTPESAAADQSWWLLHDMVPAQAGPASAVLMDQLAMLATYDVAVSCVDLTGNLESALTSDLLINGSIESGGPPDAPPQQVTVFGDGYAFPGTQDQLLWTSLGIDATATFAAWTVDAGSATMPSSDASLSGDAVLAEFPAPLPWEYGQAFTGGLGGGAQNFATLTPGSLARGGHPGWTDVEFLCRITVPTGAGSWPRILLHARDAANWVGLSWRPGSIAGGSALLLEKSVGGHVTVVASQAAPSTSGNYWLWLWCNGFNYQGQLKADAGGTQGAPIATISGVIRDAILQSGQAGIANDSDASSSVQFGGPYAGVCRVNGPVPYENVPFTVGPAAGEPAYAWIDQTAQNGDHVISIYQGPFQDPVSPAIWERSPEASAITAVPTTDYTISATIQTVNVKGGGATLTVEEFNSSGVVTTTHDVMVPLLSGTAGPVTLTGRFTTGTTTASISIRPTLYGTGLAYFAWAWATKVLPAQALFSSIGTDGANSLSWWAQQSGASWSLASHVATGHGLMLAGHPDWTNIVFQTRFQWSTGGQPAAWVRRNGTNGVRVHVDGSWLYVTKCIGGVLGMVDASHVGGASALATLTSGAFYWFQVTAWEDYIIAVLYTDLGGSPWEVVAWVSWQTGADTAALATGQVGLDTANGTTVHFGGAYPQVCTVTPSGNAVADWLPLASSGGGEPAYAWDQVDAYSGTGSLSLYAPAGAPGTTQGQWASMVNGESAAASVQPNTPITVSAQMRVAAVAGTGAYLDVVEWDASGTLVREWGVSAQIGGALTGSTGGVGTHYGGAQYGGAQYGAQPLGWQLVTATGTTGATTAFLSVRCRLAGTGTAWFDQVLVRETATAQSMTQAIPWPGSGFPGLIHVAGMGDSLYARLPLGSYMRSNQGGPQVTTVLEAQTIPTFGSAAPAVRYGLQKWQAVALTIEFMDDPARGAPGQNGLPATLREFQTVRDYAYKHGTTLYYRDSSGRMFTCALDPKHAITHEPASYQARREMTLTLNEIPNRVPPNVGQGFVLGKFSLVNAGVPALDASEVAT